MSVKLKKAHQQAKRFFQLSLVDGLVSTDRVEGVLQYIEKHQPANAVLVLKHYHRLIAAELSKSLAVVEHGGSLDARILNNIAATFTERYKRSINAVSVPKPSLIAGLRVKIGDDVFESSISSRLEALSESL
jgi:F-type H+-transporting ATPase subunit delta